MCYCRYCCKVAHYRFIVKKILQAIEYNIHDNIFFTQTNGYTNCIVRKENACRLVFSAIDCFIRIQNGSATIMSAKINIDSFDLPINRYVACSGLMLQIQSTAFVILLT